MQPVGLSSSREGSAQPLFGQVTAISVQSVKVGNLGSKHLLDGFSLVHHSGGGIEPGIVRATGPRREFAANQMSPAKSLLKRAAKLRSVCSRRLIVGAVSFKPPHGGPV